MPKSNLAVDPKNMGPRAQRQLRLLILDDDEFDRKRVQRISSELDFPTQVDEADGLMALQDRLDSHTYDAILIDYRLSKGDGLDALRIVLNHNVNNAAALIMIVGEPHYEVAVQAMKQGCDEFVGKDKLDASLLQKSILGAVLASTQKASAQLNTELQDLANSIANGVSEVYLINMRPMLSRIINQTSVLKAHETALSDQSLGALNVIEQSCQVLGDFLNNIEAKAPEELTSGTVVPLGK